MKLVLKNNTLDIKAANVCGVYGLKFPNGKWLVGYSRSILVRLARYISGEKINLKTKQAIIEYGWDSVEGYVLELCENNRDMLMRKEEAWSTKLDSYANGYNVVPCGYGDVENGKHAPRPKYDNTFRSNVSKAMRRHHMSKKRGTPKKYNNWRALWAAALKVKPGITLSENLGTPLDTEFELKFSKLSKWNKKRVIQLIKS